MDTNTVKMAIDFEKCRIINPTGKLAEVMYTKLWQMFPYDRPVYDRMMATGKKLHTMTNYALFRGDEFLGNCGLFPVSIWFDNKQIEIIGVGAVATVAQYRRQGIAGYLMKHCMNIIDKQTKPSVLFTELPAMYEEHGFEIIKQVYLTASVVQMDFGSNHFERQCFEQISRTQLDKMSVIYDNRYPNYNGKVVRTKQPDYWDFYQMFFNPYAKPRLVWALDNNELLGYARFEVEDDRLTVTEFCTGPDNIQVCESLLGFVVDFAKQAGVKIITFTFMQEHFIWQFLKDNNVKLVPEHGGIRREILMVRPAGGGRLGVLENLQWSLADKF